MQSNTTPKKRSSWLKLTAISAVCGALLLFTTSFAVWVNRYIFDTQNFASVATNSLISESSRRAIANKVTSQALESRPVIKNVAGDTITNVISGVLSSNQVRSATEAVVSKLHVILTSNNRESVVINLEGVKELLGKIIDVVGESREVKVNPDDIPSEIVLIDANKIPSFYNISVFFVWLGPLAFIGAVILLAYPYLKRVYNYKMILLVQGGAVAIIGLLALLIGPLFRPPLMANVADPDARVVVGDLFDSFVSTLNGQTITLITIGVLSVLTAGVLILIKDKKVLSKIKS